MITLDSARWTLAMVWFPGAAILFVTLVLQSMGGAYGDDVQLAWGWALPNFLPTLALMVSVFAADALKPEAQEPLLVRRKFCKLATWLSVFYLVMLLLAVFAQPLIRAYVGDPTTDRIQMLQASSLWLGPLQGLVVIALGVLFFTKENAQSNAPKAAAGVETGRGVDA